MTTQARNLPAPSPALALTDDEVVRKILDGETGLFEILMRRYNRRLYRVARAILRDDDEAEDVMRHAYVAAYTHLGQYAGRALFSTWLTRIAVHEALARLRRRQREIVSESVPEPAPDPGGRRASIGADPEQQFLQDEVRRLIESAVDSLPVAYRSVFVLREVEGLTTLEVAQCLELSADVVKTRLHRARLRLRERLLAVASPAEVYPFAFPRCDRVVQAVFARLGRVGTELPPAS
jgi:RNA polymerase sigma-70 factor (ECF subfamily)